MYLKSYKDQLRLIEGKLSMIMPFPLSGNDGTTANWPVIDPRVDGGKYIMGLFEGGKDADGIHVQGVSTWTSPNEMLANIRKEAGTDVTFKAVSKGELIAALPENIAYEIVETMLLVGSYSYYGVGQDKKQEQSDRWLYKGTKTIELDTVVKNGGPWSFA